MKKSLNYHRYTKLKFALALVIFSFLFGVKNYCLGQSSGKIVYEAVLESENYEKRKAVLLFENQSSFFFIENIRESITGKENNVEYLEMSQGDDFDFNIEPPDKPLIHEVNIDRENKLLRSRKFIYKKGKYQPSIVVEPTGSINWDIKNESKMIDSLKVYKATTDFRGRSYVAWFTPEINIDAGPWKFHGLPGLILEIVDEEKGVHFSSISVNLHHRFSGENFKLKEDLVMTLNEFALLNDPKNITDEFVEWLNSSLPEGATVINTSSISTKIERNGIEREF